MRMDEATRDAIKSKFLLGTGSDDLVVPKQDLVGMSSSLTSIETSFNQLKAHTTNILHIQEAMQKAAIVSMKKSSSPLKALEALSGESGPSSNDQLTSVFPQLTQILNQLHKSFDKLDMSGESDAPSDKASGSVAKAIPAAAAPVEEPDQDVGALQKQKATIAVAKQNAKTEQARQATKSTSDIAKKTSTKTSKPVAPTKVKTESKVEKQLTQTATKAVGKQNVGVTAATKAQPTGNVSGAGWTTKLSGFIGKSVTNVKSSIADFLANIGTMLGVGGAAAAGGAAGFAAGSLSAPDEGGSAPTGGKAGDMEAAINKAGIKDNTVKAQIMAQTAHESGNFKYTQELGNSKYFEKYNGRRDLGNTQPGDGPKYRGRGFLQVTGRANYAEMSKLLGVDFVNNPEALAQPKYAAASAIAWFQKRWGRFKNWGDTKAVTKVVNGGYNGLADRSSKFAQYSKLYGSGGSAGAASAPGGGGGGGGAGGKQAPGGAGYSDNVKAVGGSIKQYANLGSNVNYEGLKPTMKRRFTAMAAEHYQKTGKKLQINSALRTRADQERMWKKYGPKRAAPPGRSLHESGVAIDVNTPDVQRLQKLGLLKKYGFWLPYFPKETWHLEPVEGSRVKGQPDNPYQPGAPIAQKEKGKEVVQDSTGKSKQVTAPKKQVGAVATGMAIQKKVGDKTVIQNQAGPVVVAGGSNPMGYLTGMKPAKGATRYNVNTADDYKIYFNAA